MSFDIHDYHLESVKERLDLLLLVLQYDSQEEKHFTKGQRILINQQRADLEVFIRYLFKKENHNEVRFILLPKELDEKIDLIKNNINQMAWKSQITN